MLYPPHLEHEIDAEIFGPQLDTAGLASGNYRELDAALLQHLETMTIERMKRLDLFRAIGVYKEPSVKTPSTSNIARRVRAALA